MQAGKLDRPIEILRPVTAMNDAGEYVTIYEVFAAPVWADHLAVQGNERYVVSQFLAEVTAIFKIRFRTDIDAKMLIRHEGRLYDILGFPEIGRAEGLAINARARVDNG